MIIDWLENGPLDFEYKQYRLLAYLKRVDEDWNRFLLYPHLTNVVEYNRILTNIRKSKKEIEDLFPKEIKGIDTEKMELIYEVKEQPNTKITEDLEEIIDWGIEKLTDYSQVGIIIYEDIAEDIKIEKIGIDSIIDDEGYIFFMGDLIQVYYFNVGKLLIGQDNGRYLMTKKLDEIEKGKFETVEQVKIKYLKTLDRFSVPNFYMVEGHKPYPMEETVIPIVKRKILVNSRL